MLVADVPMLKDRIDRRIKDAIKVECDSIRYEMKSDKVVITGIDVVFEDAYHAGVAIDSFVSRVACDIVIDGVQI